MVKTGILFLAVFASMAFLPPVGAQPDRERLYRQAVAAENAGKIKDALRLYRRAARAGSGKAAKRLGEIFDKGAPGVPRDYAESLQWYETARTLGEKIDGGWGCPPNCK